MCLNHKFIEESIKFVGIYVNVLLVTSTRAALVEKFFQRLASLSIKKPGAVKKFLGMRIHHNERCGYDLDQEEEIDEILHDIGMDSVKIVQSSVEDDYHEENLGDEYPLPVHASDG